MYGRFLILIKELFNFSCTVKFWWLEFSAPRKTIVFTVQSSHWNLERLSPRPTTIWYSNGNSYMISVENSNIKRQENWNKKNTHADFDTDCCRRVVLRGCP